MTRTHRILLLLLLLQATLLAAVWSRRAGSDPEPAAERFLIGASFGILDIGSASRLEVGGTPDGPWTLVLAFSATCQWCDSVAPAWEALTRTPPPGVRIAGVTRDLMSVAEAYLGAHGWRVHTLLAAADSLPGTAGAELTSRTPWFYLFDRGGMLRRTGHGASAAEAVQELVPRTANPETSP